MFCHIYNLFSKYTKNSECFKIIWKKNGKFTDDITHKTCPVLKHGK